MWEPGMWGFGWMLPLMGLVMCIAFMALMAWMMSGGRGLLCMSGHGRGHRDALADVQREIGELKKEIQQLRGPR